MTIAAVIESFTPRPPSPYQIELKFKRLNPAKLFSLFIIGINSTNCNRSTSNIHVIFEINNNDIKKNKSNNY